jgi:hypothetical protein
LQETARGDTYTIANCYPYATDTGATDGYTGARGPLSGATYGYTSAGQPLSGTAHAYTHASYPLSQRVGVKRRNAGLHRRC